MAGKILRRSPRLAAAAGAVVAAVRSDQIISSLKPVNASASFSKKAGSGKLKKVSKGDGHSTQNSGVKRSSHETSPRDLLLQTTADDIPKTKSQRKNGRPLIKLPNRDMEAELWEMGFQHIAGVDEAGRGPLAGPVVAAACIIPSCVTIEGINDSKKLTEIRREELYSKITSTPGISYAVHVIDAARIDEVNILQATMQAMAACVQKLFSNAKALPSPDFILVDGNRLPEDFPENARSVIKGDAECHVIAAASILAKVTRDRLMHSYDKTWPVYGFKAHKGYGTTAHIAALLKHGPCEIHRRSFAPLKDQGIVTAEDL